MKAETKFRRSKIEPFLKTLKNCHAMTIQQVTIVGDFDKVLCINGLFVSMEIKASEKDKPKKLQVEKGKSVEKAGGFHLAVYPENWETVKLFLLNLDGGKNVIQAKARKVIEPGILPGTSKLGGSEIH